MNAPIPGSAGTGLVPLDRVDPEVAIQARVALSDTDYGYGDVAVVITDLGGADPA